MNKNLIGEDLKKELTRKRNMIAQRVEALAAAQKEYVKLQRQHEALPLQIAELEKECDADDDATIQKIAALQTKLRVVERQTAQAETATAGAALELRRVNQTGYLFDLFGSHLQQIEEAIAEKLAAVYEPARAKMMARDTDAWRTVLHFLKYDCAGIADAEAGAKEALRMLDLLLEGKAPGFDLLASANTKTAVNH